MERSKTEKGTDKEEAVRKMPTACDAQEDRRREKVESERRRGEEEVKRGR